MAKRPLTLGEKLGIAAGCVLFVIIVGTLVGLAVAGKLGGDDAGDKDDGTRHALVQSPGCTGSGSAQAPPPISRVVGRDSGGSMMLATRPASGTAPMHVFMGQNLASSSNPTLLVQADVDERNADFSFSWGSLKGALGGSGGYVGFGPMTVFDDVFVTTGIASSSDPSTSALLTSFGGRSGPILKPDHMDAPWIPPKKWYVRGLFLVSRAQLLVLVSHTSASVLGDSHVVSLARTADGAWSDEAVELVPARSIGSWSRLVPLGTERFGLLRLSRGALDVYSVGGGVALQSITRPVTAVAGTWGNGIGVSFTGKWLALAGEPGTVQTYDWNELVYGPHSLATAPASVTNLARFGEWVMIDDSDRMMVLAGGDAMVLRTRPSDPDASWGDAPLNLNPRDEMIAATSFQVLTAAPSWSEGDQWFTAINGLVMPDFEGYHYLMSAQCAAGGAP